MVMMNAMRGMAGMMGRKSGSQAILQQIGRRHAGTHVSGEQTASAFSTYLFFGIPVVTTFSLGVWQVYRLNRKYGLIEERTSRLAMPALTELDDSEELDYRQIELRGKLIHEEEMLVGPRSAPSSVSTAVLQWGGSTGLLVVTPMKMDDGKVILVNRGWIPQRLCEREKRAKAVINPYSFLELGDEDDESRWGDTSSSDEYVTIRGILRRSDEKNRFTPCNKPQSNEWYSIEPGEMRADSSRYVLELTDPKPRNGWPFPRSMDSFVDFRTPPETHMTYAATWFSLSFFLALLSRKRVSKR